LEIHGRIIKDVSDRREQNESGKSKVKVAQKMLMLLMLKIHCIPYSCRCQQYSATSYKWDINAA